MPLLCCTIRRKASKKSLSVCSYVVSATRLGDTPWWCRSSSAVCDRVGLVSSAGESAWPTAGRSDTSPPGWWPAAPPALRAQSQHRHQYVYIRVSTALLNFCHFPTVQTPHFLQSQRKFTSPWNIRYSLPAGWYTNQWVLFLIYLSYGFRSFM